MNFLRRLLCGSHALDLELCEACQLAYILYAMPKRMRQVITLYKVYGYTGVQVAARLHLSQAVVDTDLRAAMRRIADAYDGNRAALH